MARPKRIIRTVRIEVRIPIDIAARLDMMLYSEVLGRVPFGARSEFVEGLINRALEEATDNENRSS